MRLFYQPLISEGYLFLDVDESRHCIKVLRLKIGDPIKVIDGTGICYECEISDDNPRKCQFIITNSTITKEKPFHIHIAIAPTKNQDRLEWFIEKAVEFGVDKISLIHCRQSERKTVKLDRLKKKAVGAMKQSLHFKQPEIQELMAFNAFIETNDANQKFIAYVDEHHQLQLQNAAQSGKSYLVLIGPEGDFSEQEIKAAKSHQYEAISLGKSRLRTETAGIAACHILNLING